MSFTKPMVIIDLDEYEALKKTSGETEVAQWKLAAQYAIALGYNTARMHGQGSTFMTVLDKAGFIVRIDTSSGLDIRPSHVHIVFDPTKTIRT